MFPCKEQEQNTMPALCVRYSMQKLIKGFEKRYYRYSFETLLHLKSATNFAECHLFLVRMNNLSDNNLNHFKKHNQLFFFKYLTNMNSVLVKGKRQLFSKLIK